MADDILVACETGVISFEGDRVIVHKGVTRVRAGHPLTKGYEDMFEPIGVHYDYDRGDEAEPPVEEPPVEQATAAPGEKRTTRRRDKADGGA